MTQVLDAGIGEAERAAGEGRIAAALLVRRGLQHRTRRRSRSPSAAERGIAGADHQHVDAAEVAAAIPTFLCVVACSLPIDVQTIRSAASEQMEGAPMAHATTVLGMVLTLASGWVPRSAHRPR